MVIAPSPENPAFAGMTDCGMTYRDASPPPDTSASPKKFTRMTEFFEDRFG